MPSGSAATRHLKVLVNAFYALDRRKTPMFVSFTAVALNLLLNWFFTVQLGWGHQGLALSTACIATSNFLLLYFLMRQQLKQLETRTMLALLGKLTIAGGVLAESAGWEVITFWLIGPPRRSYPSAYTCLRQSQSQASHSWLSHQL